jgi:hypothetical protein
MSHISRRSWLLLVAVAKLVLALAISMVLINKEAVACACIAFSSGVHGLSRKPDHNGVYKSAACFCCDKLLQWCDNEAVSLKLLRGRRKSYEASEFVHPDLKEYYTYKGQGSELWMSSMMLSPRSIWVRDTNEAPNKGVPGLRCCADCSMSRSDRHEGGKHILCCHRRQFHQYFKISKSHCKSVKTRKIPSLSNFHV